MSKAKTIQPLLPTEKLGGRVNSLSKEACLINGSQEEDADGYEPPYESQDMSNKKVLLTIYLCMMSGQLMFLSIASFFPNYKNEKHP